MRKIYAAFLFALTALMVPSVALAQGGPTPLSTDLSSLAESAKTDILTSAGSYMTLIFGTMVVFVAVALLWRYIKRFRSG